MREIKFRGVKADVTGKEFVYGHYCTDQIYMNGQSCVDVELIRNDCHEDHIIRPNTVAQYTGEKDKNGVEIYEGDICNVFFEDREYRIFSDVCEVIFEKSCFRFKYDGLHIIDIKDSSIEYFEIIGNIYENPQLLKQS